MSNCGLQSSSSFPCLLDAGEPHTDQPLDCEAGTEKHGPSPGIVNDEKPGYGPSGDGAQAETY